jgi:hypothetical protein
LLAIAALGGIAAVFAICAHVLGPSISEHEPSAPAGQWTDDGDVVIVEVPTAPSPFATTAPAPSGPSSTRAPTPFNYAGPSDNGP